MMMLRPTPQVTAVARGLATTMSVATAALERCRNRYLTGRLLVRPSFERTTFGGGDRTRATETVFAVRSPLHIWLSYPETC